VPFDAQTMPLLCTMVLQDEPPPLGPRVPDLPKGFEAVVRRCLAKDRNERFQNVHELARALAQFAPAEAQRSLDRIARLAGSEPPYSGARMAPAVTHTSVEQSPFAGTVHPKHKGWAAGVVFALLIALAFGAWRWTSPSAGLAGSGIAGNPGLAGAPSFGAAAPAGAELAAAAPAPPEPSAASAAPASTLPAPIPSAGAPASPAAAAGTTPPPAPRTRSKAKTSRHSPAATTPAPAPSEPAAAPPPKPNPLDGRL
jgi:hypothetical protein